MDERMLISKIQEGDTGLFEELISSYQRKIYSLALRILRNEEDAGDASQEAILKIYRAIGSFQGKSSFSTWVYMVTRNACLDFIRRRAHISDYEEGMPEYDCAPLYNPSAETPEGAYEKKERRLRIIELIRSLPEEQKTVLVLRDVDGYAYGEIAEILNISEGTVKSRLFRAREALRQLLKANEV